MSGELRIIDSGILQFTPKGAYYEGQSEQYNEVKSMWMQLFNNDRTLFSLILLLNGTGFSKGAMTQILLSNPLKDDMLPTKIDGLPQGFENEIIAYALYKERTPRALKNLLMLTKGENRVNNSRTRKFILDFIFNRNNKELDFLAVNYKGKLQKLVRHAIGKQDLYKILNGNEKIFQKFIGRYNRRAYPVLCHIFNKDIPAKGFYFPMIDHYYNLREAAQKGNVDNFRKHMKKLPIRTVMGMRNLYKVQIDKAELLEKTQTSTKDKIHMQAAAKRVGAKLDVNYEKQDIYDLFKFLYFEINQMNEENLDKIFTSIYNIESKISKIDIGECIVIMDASHSMIGSDERPMHPFLTGQCIISTIAKIQKVLYVGGKSVILSKRRSKLLVPGNSTNLWRGLIKAVSTGIKNIVVISDGYENTIKGMFNHVYNYLKESGYDFKLIHINPVFSGRSSEGTTKRLVTNIKPLPVADYKYLETEIIFSKLLEDKKLVIKLLVQKYKNLLC